MTLEEKWNSVPALTNRLEELLIANPPPEATERLLQALDLSAALDKKTPQQLVDLCLNNLTNHTTDESFASLVQEICTRLDPTWGDRCQAEDDERAREAERKQWERDHSEEMRDLNTPKAGRDL